MNEVPSRSDRAAADAADSFDEELEMEIDDERLERLLDGTDAPIPGGIDRKLYFYLQKKSCKYYMAWEFRWRKWKI